jgi:two-component system sensor histidine kinase ChvG
MALDIERPLGWRTAMGSAVRSFLGRVSGPVSEHSPDAGEARSSIPLVERLMGLGASVKDRLNFRSLYWRILLANLFGLLVMLAGIVGVSQHQAWLIEAKTESLRAQGEILAAAIAANATGDERGVAFPDPDRLLEAGPGASVVAGGYGGEDFEFQIRPEKVARFLHRMTAPSGIRARIYDADLTMIYDTRGIERRPSRRDSDSAIVTQNVWTWLDSLFVPSNLNHYKEIGSANGSAYAEVRNALAGVAHSMIQVTDRGRHIVSVATPIRRTDKVIGVLLMATRDGDIDGILRKERHMISWVFAIAVITTALSAAFLAKTIAGPMRRLSEAAERVRNSMRTREDFPAFANRKDEIGQMAGSFRDMTAAMYRRIELSEKFAADVAHELKNPITAVRSATESLSYVQSDEDRKELLHNINKDLSRLNKLITDI